MVRINEIKEENNMFENEIKMYLKKYGFNTFTPKAVLFDMDGVIYDSMPNHAISWHKAMDSFGLFMNPDDAYAFEGMRGIETIKLLSKRQWGKDISEEEAQKMYNEKSRLFNLCPKANKMDGIEELMHKIKAAGLKIVVVTGSGQKTLLDKLETEFKGLIHKELTVTSFDVNRGKPDPEPYLCGMEKAGIKPWEGIVVENAPLGVRAATAAKLFTIAVNTGPLPDKMLSDEGANLIFDNMPALRDNWENLISAL